MFSGHLNIELKDSHLSSSNVHEIESKSNLALFIIYYLCKL